MGRVFKYLGDEGVREDEMKRAMISMPFTPGIVELFKLVKRTRINLTALLFQIQIQSS